MEKRQIVKMVLEGLRPPYVPWHCTFTTEAAEKLISHFGRFDIDNVIGNHFIPLGNAIGFFKEMGNNCYKDTFGVIWDRTVDRDIGMVVNRVLERPSLNGYKFPNPWEQRFFADIPRKINRFPDLYRCYQIGFSLYERAWTMRGMENLMVDFYENPNFVRDLFHAIAEYNIAQIREVLDYDIDAIYFGDDWGQQHGLQMGPQIWQEFIFPELKRMFQVVRSAGKNVFVHSCGDVDELFDDLVGIGLNCFNPFQPEVMNVFDLVSKYRGKLSFHGGLSTQKTLPYGSPEDVKIETLKLISAGSEGSYIFAPAHAVEGDVPLDNMIAFIETLHSQKETNEIAKIM
jgi:uroporphyrinogen decarboxylase